MKKFIVGILLIGIGFCGNPQFIESIDNGEIETGYNFIQLNVRGQEVGTPDYAVSWYGYNLSGYSVMGLDYLEATSGNTTTIDCQPIYSSGKVNVGTTNAQTITYGGTDITDIYTHYKFTYRSNVTTTTNVTFNFVIAE